MRLDETMPTSCTNPYGWTKYMNERILTDVAKANPDWSVVLLRYFNPIGAHESGRIGECPTEFRITCCPMFHRLRPENWLICMCLETTIPHRMVRAFVIISMVVDLARGHIAAADFAMKHTGTEIINLGTGHGYSVLDIVKAFEKVNGVKVPYKIEARRPGDIAECWADPTKAKELLGWTAPEKSWRTCAAMHGAGRRRIRMDMRIDIG